jgi:hypothetical protein
MTARRKCIMALLGACATWIVVSAIFRFPPAGMTYIGQSLNSCTSVLKQVEMMKATYADDKGLREGDPVDPSDFHRHFGGHVPKCPGGGTYSYNNIGVPPVCSFTGTRGLEPQKELVMYFFWKWKIPPSGRHEL